MKRESKFVALDGRIRTVIEGVAPAVDAGRFPVKRVSGEALRVEADCFTDGHDSVRALLGWRAEGDASWSEIEMAALGNDRWRAAFRANEPGRYVYRIEAWVDHLLSWRREFARRESEDDLRVAALVGAQLIKQAAGRA